MKLTYWTAENEGASAYDIRAKTKKEAKATLDAHPCPEDFGPIYKIVLNYTDGFELLNECLGEDRGNCIRIE